MDFISLFEEEEIPSSVVSPSLLNLLRCSLLVRIILVMIGKTAEELRMMVRPLLWHIILPTQTLDVTFVIFDRQVHE